jgi:uncharacterized protein (DUF58 family)
LVSELCATIAFSAIKNNDKVGLTLFTDAIEKSVPPRKGARHVLRLIRELLYCEPIGRGTNLTTAIEHLGRTSSRRSVVFLVSDFQDSGFERALRIARQRHDVIPLVVSDQREFEMPNVGLIRLRDAETGNVVELDTGSKRTRRQYEHLMRQRAEQRDTLFRRLRLDSIHLRTGEDFVEPLQRFFRQRELRR